MRHRVTLLSAVGAVVLTSCVSIRFSADPVDAIRPVLEEYHEDLLNRSVTADVVGSGIDRISGNASGAGRVATDDRVAVVADRDDVYLDAATLVAAYASAEIPLPDALVAYLEDAQWWSIDEPTLTWVDEIDVDEANELRALLWLPALAAEDPDLLTEVTAEDRGSSIEYSLSFDAGRTERALDEQLGTNVSAPLGPLRLSVTDGAITRIDSDGTSLRLSATADPFEFDPTQSPVSSLADDTAARLQAVSYGDDALLDALWDDCRTGDEMACDGLYLFSAANSTYETFGASCGGRQPDDYTEWCDPATSLGGIVPNDGPETGDEGLATLRDACADGDMRSCDELYLQAPAGSSDQVFGGSCGGRQPDDYAEWCDPAGAPPSERSV